MKIDGSVALVTGANRGLGQAFARELVSRGAAKVYGAARDPGKVTEPGVTADRPRHHRRRTGRPGRRAVRGRQPAGEQRRGAAVQHVHRRAGPGRRPAGDGDQLLRHAAHVPGVRAGAGRRRRRRDRQHAVGHQLLHQPVQRVLRRLQGRGVVADQRRPARAPPPGHPGGRGARQLHRHRDGRAGQRARRSAPNRSPGRPSTRSRPARSRCSPTSGPGTSRPSCPATTS